MEKRFFTVNEANELIPFLSDRLTRIRRTHGELGELSAREPLDPEEITLRGGTPVHGRYLSLVSSLHSDVTEICSRGCQLKDLESGLIDFPTIWEGREVYLCWKLGETRVGFWHEVEAGFSGRQALELEPDS